ncbi:hypothetical protein, partial [Luteolibacter pohnpeiensis]|uniref:hypothetical protein n=1 Tax=Luteolibacter pohnpeiensis TaxID=454153 RepID=UPI001F2976FD
SSREARLLRSNPIYYQRSSNYQIHSDSPITNQDVIPAAAAKVKLPNQSYSFLSRTLEWWHGGVEHPE